MDSTYIIGITIGGVVIATLGAIAEYAREKEYPSWKGVARDFIIGCVMVLFILQIMPESVSTLIGYLPSVKTLTDSMPSVSTMTGGSVEPDLQVGPARF